MATPLGILPHRQWKELVADVDLHHFRGDPRVRVADDEAFGEMQAYVTDLHRGVEAVHSFEDAAGSVFDCVPIEHQPSLSGQTGPLPQPPDLRPVMRGEPPRAGSPAVRPEAEEPPRDRHGNVMQAPPGTIPLRRVTLGELVRFRTLSDFSRKEPGPRAGRGEPPASPAATRTRTRARAKPSAPSTDTGQNHRYAYTHQTVDAIGAHNALSVYSPVVGATQIFSLAQHWYTAGTGTGHQTLEVGWQVYPTKYGHAQPVLFIFWTADNYATTGAYNLDQPGFVQTNSAWTIGGALSPSSVQGGQQMEIEVAVYLFAGNWWIYLGGLAAANAVGYYPTSLYSGGAMATKATEILFGGETVCKSGSWPGMGSGAMASAGWRQAAYQRDIFYFPAGGGSAWASLTPEQPSPGCYTLALGSSPSPWNIYFFFGGPGAGNC